MIATVSGPRDERDKRSTNDLFSAIRVMPDWLHKIPLRLGETYDPERQNRTPAS